VRTKFDIYVFIAVAYISFEFLLVKKGI